MMVSIVPSDRLLLLTGSLRAQDVRPGAILPGSQDQWSPAETHRLMIVDDNLSFVKAVGRLLELRGFHITTFAAAFEALAALAAAPSEFDAVLTDLTMPQMSGEDFILALHALRPDLPVIVSTGRDWSMKDAARAQLGVTEILLKPWSIDEAVAAIRRVLN